VHTDDGARYDAVRRRYAEVPAHALLGFSLEEIGPGRADVRMRTSPSVVNPNGVVHAGVLGAIVHSAVVQSARTLLQSQDSVSVIELTVTYLLPGHGEAFVCRAEVIHMQGDVGVCNASLRDLEDTTLAVATGVVHAERHREP
jgi:uncharacterized protein (TIGR00369 family)